MFAAAAIRVALRKQLYTGTLVRMGQKRPMSSEVRKGNVEQTWEWRTRGALSCAGPFVNDIQVAARHLGTLNEALR